MTTHNLATKRFIGLFNENYFDRKIRDRKLPRQKRISFEQRVKSEFLRMIIDMLLEWEILSGKKGRA